MIKSGELTNMWIIKTVFIAAFWIPLVSILVNEVWPNMDLLPATCVSAFAVAGAMEATERVVTKKGRRSGRAFR